MTWTGNDGWPAPYPDGLAEAIRRLPGADRFSEDDVHGMAAIIAAVSDGGRDAELPRSRMASEAKSEEELAKLIKLCAALTSHIKAMHLPSLDALSAQQGRGDPFVLNLASDIECLAEAALLARGTVKAPQVKAGAERKIEAADVADISASIFEKVTSRRATYTTHESGKVSGDWPEFLGAVFRSLYIRASIASQVRRVSEKMPPD